MNTLYSDKRSCLERRMRLLFQWWSP